MSDNHTTTEARITAEVNQALSEKLTRLQRQYDELVSHQSKTHDNAQTAIARYIAIKENAHEAIETALKGINTAQDMLEALKRGAYTHREKDTAYRMIIDILEELGKSLASRYATIEHRKKEITF